MAELILREDVPNLGIIGDIVRVRPGYARNYLLPRGLAVAANRRNLKELEHHKRMIAAKKMRERGTWEGLLEKLEATTIEVEMRASKTGKLFGSVTNIDLYRLLAVQGIEIDRRKIGLKSPIKEIGRHEIPFHVGQDIYAKLVVVVKPLGGVLAVDDGAGAPPSEVLPGYEDAGATGEADSAAIGQEQEMNGADSRDGVGDSSGSEQDED